MRLSLQRAYRAAFEKNAYWVRSTVVVDGVALRASGWMLAPAVIWATC